MAKSPRLAQACTSGLVPSKWKLGNKVILLCIYVFIVNELYKTVNKTENVTPGRVRNHNES